MFILLKEVYWKFFSFYNDYRAKRSTFIKGNQNYSEKIASQSYSPPSVGLRLHKGSAFEFSCTFLFSNAEILLIHSAGPQNRPVVIIIFAKISVRPSVRPHFSKYLKTNQKPLENYDHYWWDCGSGRGDHWWHMSWCF